MDALIGNGLHVEALNLALPFKVADRPCRDCGHGWNTKPAKKKPNGHVRKTGKCGVSGCGCAEMKIA